MQEPIFLEPIFKDYIWGGNKLKEVWGKKSPYDITAESWEVSTNKNGKSIVRNGEYKGKDLEELFQDKNNRLHVFGSKTKDMDKFPLLIKFIDAASNLSVQVHPNDEYAFEKENGEKGKTEMWYIMECKEGAQIICGMKKGVRQEDLPKILTSDNVADYLEFLNVKQGDVIYIPSGTIHAILGDTIICEVQQNSDLTYRVYDWGRVGADGKLRELHVQKAIETVDVESRPELKNTQNIGEEENIISSDYFKTNKVNVENTYTDTSNEETFFAYNVVKGNGKLIVNETEYILNLGDSFIIPAQMGNYEIQGEIELLKSYI